jgi:heme oxygenase
MTTAALSLRLRDETQALHTKAERSGIMRPLLRGQLGARGYALLLRNLHPIYVALEAGITAAGGDASVAPVLAPYSHPGLARAARLASDLDTLEGPGWTDLALAPSAREYAVRLSALAAEHPRRLLSHAYVRYMGDLSGGQHIRHIVATSCGPRIDGALAFYDFTALGDLAAFKARVRAEMDGLLLPEAVVREVVQEAQWAFETHVTLFHELDRLRDDGAPSTGLVAPV